MIDQTIDEILEHLEAGKQTLRNAARRIAQLERENAALKADSDQPHSQNCDLATGAGKRATLKVPEAAEIAGTGQSAIRNAIAEGRIPHLRFGRNILIPREPFLKWLNGRGDVK
jgi:excisionase family DNA binding protein